MSRTCEKCERGPLYVASRSHSNIATKRRQLINLQTKKVGNKRLKICAKCIKTLTKRTVV